MNPLVSLYLTISTHKPAFLFNRSKNYFPNELRENLPVFFSIVLLKCNCVYNFQLKNKMEVL